MARPGFLTFSATAGTGPSHRTPEAIPRAFRSRSDTWMETTMSENTKPADDGTNEDAEVEAHSVLDLQETASNHDIVEPPGNCVSTVSLVLG